MKSYMLVIFLFLYAGVLDAKESERTLEKLGYSSTIESFERAIKRDDLEALKIYIDSGIVDTFRKEKKNPIGTLAFHGSREAFKLWLDYFNPPSGAYAYEKTMWFFIGIGKEKHAILLSEYIEDPNYTFDYGMSLLLTASQQGMMTVVQKLVELGASPNASDDFGNIAATLAIRNDNLETYKFLIKNTDFSKVTELSVKSLLGSIMRNRNFNVEALRFLFGTSNIPLTNANYNILIRSERQIGNQSTEAYQLIEDAFKFVKETW
ncbi:ankyrin repeat domain-containing protein [Kangiella marina]|uniref:Ankyrin repeat domain-containing protein n=1 Tax=Kangiella marina TaxID=1079178 RepID=A0ABP8INI8_9GAMM